MTKSNPDKRSAGSIDTDLPAGDRSPLRAASEDEHQDNADSDNDSDNGGGASGNQGNGSGG